MCERPYETTKRDDRQNRLRDVARLGGLAKVYYRVIMPRRHGGLAAGDRIHNFSTGAVAVLQVEHTAKGSVSLKIRNTRAKSGSVAIRVGAYFQSVGLEVYC